MTTYVIEGIDGSGKSTLARSLAQTLGLTIQESEGPPKFRGEMNQRVKRYFTMERTLFVRHPCISQPLYTRCVRREEDIGVNPDLIEAFYAAKPIVIYCDPIAENLDNHVVKEGEDPAHLKALDERYSDLLTAYRLWAAQNALVCYRIGDPVDRLVRMIDYAIHRGQR